MAGPEATLNPLHFPDGSASYTSATGAQVLASINGPIDFHRRDSQRPDEAAVEVVVKPSVGQSGVCDRHAESIIRQALGRIILRRERGMPRGGIVVTLIVLQNPASNGRVSDRGSSSLPILPSLLNAALLALLAASIPLSMTYTAVLIAVTPDKKLLRDPSQKDVNDATSLHAIALSSTGRLLLGIDEGDFDIDTYGRVYELAEASCLPSTVEKDVDSNMTEAGAELLETFVRNVVEDKIREDLSWKIAAA
ncbi:exosome non-catalytic core subunit rrp46 [Ascosphaera aggregata]|nr:exosome non-catalytic core subunit rrp46 [Ascosphaera aggregata]